MAEEVKEYLDYDGLAEYDKKSKELFQDLTIQDVEEAFNELDESDPSYSAFYDVIQKAKEATSNADSKAAAAVTATNNANTAISKADAATERANKAAERIETVNDMTTGINLIRGSRDFTLGTNIAVKNVYADGFSNIGEFDFYKDKEGFVVAHKSQSGLSSNSVRFLFANAIENVAIDDSFTINFEFMIDDIVSFDDLGMFQMLFASSSGSDKGVKVYTLNDFGYSKSDVRSGVWYKAVATYKSEFSTTDGYIVRPSFLIMRNGSINFRKPMVQRGHINNPIYSVSPADLSLEPVNDITTGMNLLRGTRDWTIHAGTSTPNNTEGFTYNASNYEVSKDLDGRSIITFNKSLSTLSYLNTSVIRGFKQGQAYTLFYEVMFHEYPGAINLFGYAHRNLSNASKRAVSYSVSNLGEIELNKWYKVVFPFVISDAVDLGDYLFFSIGLTKANLSLRPLCLYEGFIEHPEWSISSFDIPQNRSETYGIVNKVTAKEGFTVVDAKLEVCNRVAQLYIAIDISIDINPNKTYTVATLDSSIWPALHASSASRTSANIPLVGNIGPTGVIDMCSSGTTLSTSRIYILSTYILNHSFDPSKLSS